MADLTIKDVRAKFPQYDDMDDQSLADALHGKFYSDMPKDTFYAKIGFGAAMQPLVGADVAPAPMQPPVPQAAPQTSGMPGILEAMTPPPAMVQPPALADLMAPAPSAGIPPVGTGIPSAVTPAPTRTGEMTQHGRPIWQGQGGEEYSEKTITLQGADGSWFNVPTVNSEGGQLDPEVLERIIRGKNSPSDPITGQALQPFKSVDDAVSAAQNRSSGMTPAIPPSPTAPAPGSPAFNGRPAPLDVSGYNPPQTPIVDLMMPPPDPFAGEGMGPLLQRRGQQAARGAVEVAASMPEAAAIAGSIADQSQVEGAENFSAERAATIAGMQERLKDPNLPPEARALIERNLADMLVGQERLGEMASAPVVPADQRPAFAYGDTIRKGAENIVGAPDPRDTSFWGKVAEGGGNMLGFVASGILTGGVGTAVTGAALNSSQIYKEAREAGADEPTARRAASFGAALGATEIIPIQRALKFLPAKLRGEVANKFTKRLLQVGQSGGEEAMQELVQSIGNNMIAQGIYDPERGILDGAGEAALIGAILGGGVNVAGQTASAAIGEKPEAQTMPPRPPNDGVAPLDAAGPGVGRTGTDGPVTQPPAPFLLGPDARADQAPQIDTAPPSKEAQPLPKEAQPPADQTEQPGPAPEPRIEIMDETETVDGQTRPTGRKVRVNLDTGEVSPLEPENGGSDQSTAVQDRPQDASVVGADVTPAAGTAQEEDADAAAIGSIRTRTLSTEEVGQVQTDAATFQYKDNGDQDGVTDRLQDVPDWDERSAMGGIIYEYADGRRVIADGHQRLGLAKRLQAAGKATPWNVEVIREADGFTPADVRRIAALKNIREGSGTAIDAAKVLREAPKEIDTLNLPPKSALVRDAKGLARLSDDAFGMVVNEVVKPEWGAAVGQNVPDQAAHADVVALLNKLQPKNNEQAAMIARQAAQEAVTETQTSLFGDELVSQNLYLERAKVLDGAIRRLKQGKATFKVLSDRADTIAKAGNVLNAEANAARVDEDGRAQAYLNAEANRKGPISDALTTAAKELKANPKAAGRIVSDFLKTVRDPQLDAGQQDGGGADPEGEGRPQGVQAEPAVAPQTEKTDAGQQSLIPGVEPVTDKARAEAQMAKPKQGQDQGAGSGRDDLFGNPDDRRDLFDGGQADVQNVPNVQNVQSETAAEPEPKPTEKPAPKAERIEDFGEKLEGAAKFRDEWLGKSKMVEDANVLDQPFAKVWPEPDYLRMIEDGLDEWAVSFARAARDAIPPKPRVAWKAKQWADVVVGLRAATQRAISGETDQADLKRILAGNRKGADILGSIALYNEVGHEKSLKGVRLSSGSYSVYKGERFSPSKTIWTVAVDKKASAMGNFPSILAEGDTKEEAIAAFKKAWPTLTEDVAKKKAGVDFKVYSRDKRKTWSIGKKIGREFVDLKNGIATVAEARAYIAENQEALEEALKKYKETPFERRDENLPRVGADHRNGADITPEVFSEAFGFRGVQFGNYVEGPRRQADINKAYDALMDMAGVLGIPSKAISLNGSLGLAFGARGKGGKNPAAAHYEPDSIVINLTKGNGAGSLAHEWWHAADNYFSRARNDNLGYLSAKPFYRGDGVRQEVADAFKAAMSSIKATKLPERSREVDKRRTKAYWATDIELSARSFEQYIIERLNDQGGKNDYLANIVDEDYWNALDALMGESREKATYPYLLPSEIDGVRSAFDDLFNVIETVADGDGVKMYQEQPLNTDTSAFKAWFGDSKVVDADGKPLVVYHGTGADFESFDNSKTGAKDRGLWGRGHYLSSSSETANSYALREGDGARVIAAYVSLSNPLVLTTGKDLITRLPDGSNTKEMTGPNLDGSKIKDIALSGGHDGVIQIKPNGAIGDVVAFDPTQIKSVHNRGTFDANDPRILYQAPTMPTAIPGARHLNRDAAKTALPRLRRELDRLNLQRVRVAMDREAQTRQGAFTVSPFGAMDILIGQSLDPDKTMYHEAIHAMRHLDLFTPNEWAALTKKAEMTWLEQYDIAERYPNLLREEQIEEAIAEAFSDAAASKTAPRGGLLVTAFNKIARLMRAIKAAFGAQSAKDVFDAAYAGDIGARDAGNTGFVANVQRAQALSGRARDQAQPSPRPSVGPGPLIGAPFIPDRAVFEELTSANAGLFDKVRGAAGAVHDAADRARVRVQDRFLPVLRAQQAIERATGQKLGDEYDAYRVEETFSGKAGQHLDRIDQDFTRNIIDLIAEQKDLTGEMVGDWLTARHAKERNKRISEINKKLPDGGSGMTNAEADKIIAEMKASPHQAALDKIGDLIGEMRNRTLDLRVEAGLMTKEDADALRAMYKHYVPLKGFAETDNAEAALDVSGIGSKYTVKGKETKRALGRTSRSFNPLIASIVQAQEVAIRAEKNRVAQAVYRLAKDYPSTNLWTIKPVQEKRFFNSTTGMVETRAEQPAGSMMETNEMAVKVDGKEARITFHDERITRALGQVGADSLHPAIAVASMFNRFLSTMITTLDPEFMVRNAFRDITAAAINVGAVGPDAKAIRRGMVKNWPKAFYAAFHGQVGKTDSEWQKHYREFVESGAKVSFFTLENPESGAADFERRLKLSRGPAALRALKVATSPRALLSSRDNPLLGFVERMNLAVDNAVRLAAFVEARKLGWSKQKAASLSKNLTVNFNRRGSETGWLNSLFLFFNAAVQGLHVISKVMASKRGLKVMGAMVLYGVLKDQLNAALSDEDDDGELAYDKLPDYKTRMNDVWMIDGQAVTIPMPYIYALFPYVGQQISKKMRGVKDTSDAVGDIFAASLQQTSPIQVSEGFRAFIPTAMVPAFELATNEDWLGRNIRPEQAYGDYGPNAYKYYSSVTETSKVIADVLNKGTGGSVGESGMVDVSPEYIDHLAGFLTGGAGKFVGRSTDIALKLALGEPIERRDVPFARTLTFDTGDFLDRDRYYRFRNEVEEATEAADLYLEAGQKIPDHVRKMMRLKPVLKEHEKILAKQRKALRAIDDMDGLTKAQKIERKKRIYDAQARHYVQFNAAYLRQMGPQSE